MDQFEVFVIREAAKREANAMLVPSSDEEEPREEEESSSSAIAAKLVQLIEDFPLLRNVNMTKSKEKALGKVYAKTIKSKRGHKKLRIVLQMMMANPIISIRRLEYCDKLKFDLPYTEAGALFMHEICQSPDEIKRLVDEITCALHVRELRPSLQRFLCAWKQHSADQFARMLEPGDRMQECERWLRNFPRRLVLNALRLHMHSTIASALMMIMFARPPLGGGSSLFQQLLRSAFHLDAIANDLRHIASMLPGASSQAKSALAQFLFDARDSFSFAWQGEDDAEADGEVESVEVSLAKRECILAAMVQQSGGRFDTEAYSEREKWCILRYVELLRERDNQEALVDIFGDEEFVKQFVNELLLGKKNRKLIFLLFQRGSGLVKFCEALFACFDRGLQDAKDLLGASGGEEAQKELRRRLEGYADEMLAQALRVVHSMLQLDTEGLFHGLLNWLFGFYAEYAKMTMPKLDDVVAAAAVAADGDAAQEEEEELERVKTNVRADRKWAKTAVLPPVVVRIINQYRAELQGEFLKIQVPIPLASVFGEAQPATAAAAAGGGGVLLHLDVCWNVDPKLMAGRGFLQRGETSGATLWTKSSCGGSNSSSSSYLTPISDVALSFDNSEDDEEAKEEEKQRPAASVWQIIPRSLNKGVWGTFPAHLKVKRDPRAKQVVGDVRLVDTKSSINAALQPPMWRLAGTFRYDLLATMNVWVMMMDK